MVTQATTTKKGTGGPRRICAAHDHHKAMAPRTSSSATVEDGSKLPRIPQGATPRFLHHPNATRCG
eukprot:7074718-Alexandrium_andersonii.AAC.1